MLPDSYASWHASGRAKRRPLPAVTPTAKRSRVRLGAGSTLAGGTGVACVLVASPDRRDKLSVCGYLVDTWCLGVKNTIGPQRMGQRELDAFKRQYFGRWESEGIPVPLELGASASSRTPTSGGRGGPWDRGMAGARSRSAGVASRCTSTGLTTTHNECSRRSSALSVVAASTTASPSVKPTASAMATATPPR